ncbi:biliverdin-producing heme oxygenase [Nonlabens sp. SY33080]|uniref:biliverdin-producing heme oxygenase n=1 Tax=Nonlabens sp. SY33080 TaxID=2719911 RepID=UPI001428C799|nr:biliverdin-producing heme oxygenase [Nonlabens sp. SY33080]
MTLINNLRSRTKELHEKLDKAPHSIAIFNQNISREYFLEILMLNYKAYLPIEKSLSMERQPISRWIEHDYFELTQRDIHLPNIESISFTPLEMIGALYVVEGSLLGAAVIGKKLSENKNLDYNINSMQFYTSSNEERRARWKATLKLLKEDYSTSEMDEIVMGAIKTFNHFINIMT